jgi:hypothetical protein
MSINLRDTYFCTLGAHPRVAYAPTFVSVNFTVLVALCLARDLAQIQRFKRGAKRRKTAPSLAASNIVSKPR